MILSLDSANLLTHGSPIGWNSIFGVVNPRQGVFSAVVNPSEQNKKIIGQITYRNGERSARFSYLLPFNEGNSPAVYELLEGLADQAGVWGAFNLLAELDETAPSLEAFRRVGFSIYGWQRIWRFPVGCEETGNYPAHHWKMADHVDEIAIRNLFQNLVPPLIQTADPLPAHRPRGLVYYENNDLLAFVECLTGPQGIYLLPLLHPEVKDVDHILQGISRSLTPLLNRPVYMAVRSYQAWLENSLESLGAIPAERKALLVKRLATPQRAVSLVRSVLVEHRGVETSPPLANQFTHSPQEKSKLNLHGSNLSLKRFFQRIPAVNDDPVRVHPKRDSEQS